MVIPWQCSFLVLEMWGLESRNVGEKISVSVHILLIFTQNMFVLKISVYYVKSCHISVYNYLTLHTLLYITITIYYIHINEIVIIHIIMNISVIICI